MNRGQYYAAASSTRPAYSVWIGHDTCITHMALIHGPAYVGDECFIGFRSTVFNAQVGHGCIVMMHALIQDMEIPPGKYVPSGAVITTQQAADRLPDATESARTYSHHLSKSIKRCGLDIVAPTASPVTLRCRIRPSVMALAPSA